MKMFQLFSLHGSRNFRDEFQTNYLCIILTTLAFMAYVGTALAAPKVKIASAVECANPVDCISTEEISDGAITPAKLSFDPTPLARVVFVSGDGSATDNGTALQDALGDIGTSGPCAVTATASLPCLVKLGPGVFNVGDDTVEMLPFVDMEGSGRNLTTIMSVATGASSGSALFGASDAEIRNLTVDLSGTSGDNVRAAIAHPGSVFNFRVSNVTAQAHLTGTSDNAYGIGIGGGSTVTLTDVVATGTGAGTDTGVFVGGAAVVEMHHVYAFGDAALQVSNDDAVVNAYDSVFEETGSGLYAVNVGVGDQTSTANIYGSRIIGDPKVGGLGVLSIATSQIDGTAITQGSGDFVCMYTYDGDFVALDADCL